MAKKLTPFVIDKAKAGAKRREIPDAAKPGLYLIIQPNGRKSWAVRYRHNGTPRKYTLEGFPSLVLARKLAQEALDRIAEGGDPAAEKQAAKRTALHDGRDRIDQVIADFIEKYAKRNTRESTYKETEPVLKREIGTRWKDRCVQDITRRDVIQALDEIAEGSGSRKRSAPVMANRTLAAVRRLFNWCKEKDIVATSPCDGVKAPGSEQQRDRVLTDNELRLLWSSCTAEDWPFRSTHQAPDLDGATS